jgi:agmatinase
VVELLQRLIRRASIVGFDLVELMPSSDIRGLGAVTAARIVCVALGCLAHQKTLRARSSGS